MSFFKAVFFDLNGTMADIATDEGGSDLYRTMANLLANFGVMLTPEQFRAKYFALMQQQRAANPVDHPEFDVLGIFRTLLKESGSCFPRGPRCELLTEFLARAFRAASMMKLEVYPGVHEVLGALQKSYRFALVSDAQTLWAEAEMQRLDLLKYFPDRIISSALGSRKPGRQIFQTALERLNVVPRQVIFVGNDMYRDVYGAKKMGMKSVFFRSNQGDHSPHGAEPDYVIYNFGELPRAIEFLENHATESSEK